MNNKLKFTLRIERFLGGYRVALEEYNLSKITVNEKIEETHKLVERQILGNFHNIDKAIKTYNDRKEGISKNLFTVIPISCQGVYSTDFIGNDLSDVNMFYNSK